MFIAGGCVEFEPAGGLPDEGVATFVAGDCAEFELAGGLPDKGLAMFIQPQARETRTNKASQRVTFFLVFMRSSE
jgi:hypothetical protein